MRTIIIYKERLMQEILDDFYVGVSEKMGVPQLSRKRNHIYACSTLTSISLADRRGHKFTTRSEASPRSPYVLHSRSRDSYADRNAPARARVRPVGAYVYAWGLCVPFWLLSATSGSPWHRRTPNALPRTCAKRICIKLPF